MNPIKDPKSIAHAASHDRNVRRNDAIQIKELSRERSGCGGMKRDRRDVPHYERYLPI